MENSGFKACPFCTQLCWSAHGPIANEKLRWPYFVKTLTVPRQTSRVGKNCEFSIPIAFVNRHGNKFRPDVTLQGPSGYIWNIGISIHRLNNFKVIFLGGWRVFAFHHDLAIGDHLIFTLTAFSHFRVQVFDGAGQPKGTSLNSIIDTPSKWRYALPNTKVPVSNGEQQATESVTGPKSEVLNIAAPDGFNACEGCTHSCYASNEAMRTYSEDSPPTCSTETMEPDGLSKTATELNTGAVQIPIQTPDLEDRHPKRRRKPEIVSSHGRKDLFGDDWTKTGRRRINARLPSKTASKEKL